MDGSAVRASEGVVNSLVDPLDLDVEQTLCVDGDAQLREDQVREPLLVLPLDGRPLLLEGRILSMLLDPSERRAWRISDLSPWGTEGDGPT